MRKRFRPLMARIWNTRFWQNSCPVENTHLWQSPPPPTSHQSAIIRKREVPQPHVLIFFLISSTVSIRSATANIVISRWKNLETIQKKSLLCYMKNLVTEYQIWHSWAMVVLCFFFFLNKKNLSDLALLGHVILWIFFLNNIFFLFFQIFSFYFFLFLLFLFFDWQRWATIHNRCLVSLLLLTLLFM